MPQAQEVVTANEVLGMYQLGILTKNEVREFFGFEAETTEEGK